MENKKTIMISRNYIGNDENLGKILINSFIYSLTSREDHPRRIILLNSGVKLASSQDFKEDLEKLEARGTEILICGTCLDYYGLRDQVLVGQVSNMYEIVDRIIEGDIVNI